MKRIILLTAALLMIGADVVRGQDVTFKFTGRVKSVSDNANVLNGQIAVDDPVQGTYIFDQALKDRNTNPEIGDYVSSAISYGMIVDIAGEVLQTNPDDPNLRITVVLEGRKPLEQYAVYAERMSTSLGSGISVYRLDLTLLDRDPPFDSFDSDRLPLTPPDVASFQDSQIRIRGGDGNLSFSIEVELHTLTYANADPIASAGEDQVVECDDATGVLVMLDATESSDPDGDDLTYQWSVPAGVVLDDPTSAEPIGHFPIGITLATVTVTDGNGGIDCDDVQITVIDDMPPEVLCTTDVMSLWPPNGKMRDIGVFIDATDNCTNPDDLVLLRVTVESDEPDDAEGDGDGSTSGDVDGLDGFEAPVDVTEFFAYNPNTASFEGDIMLRAERHGSGSGRTYTITAFVLDSAGNLAEASCVVVVPHDQRGKK